MTESSTLDTPTATASSGRPPLGVAEKEQIAEGVCRLRLVDPRGDRLPDWTPGAHIDIGLSTGVTRQYSLCGDRWDPRSYEIAVLRTPDGRGGSQFVHEQLEVGDLVEVGGPRNNFMLVPAERYLFIAGGIGITPFLPMIDQAARMGVPWTLLYSGRQLASMAFRDRLSSWSDRVVINPSDTCGRLDLAAAITKAPAGTMVYCCGPVPMVDDVERLCAAELPPGSLRRERFVAKAYTPPLRSAPYQVELARTGRVLTLEGGQSVLDAVLDAGVPILASCRQGLCGTCETAILDGVADHRDSILSDEERERNASFFPCVSRSASDRLVVDL